MYRKEEDEPSDHKNGHWLSKDGAIVGATLGFFAIDLGHSTPGDLATIATMGISTGVGSFIGYVLEDRVYRQTPPRRWKRK